MDAEPTPPPAPAPAYTFPALGPEDFGGHHLDRDTLTLWIGVRVNPSVHDFGGAIAFLRSMEHVLWQFYAEIAKQVQLKKALTVNPKTKGTEHAPDHDRTGKQENP